MKIIAFTGAGISKQSHIPTFMEAPEVREKLFRHFAERHHEEYNEVIRQLKANMNGAEPNDAHYALAEYGVPIITMNIDGLHRKVGSNALELHGGLPEGAAYAVLRDDAPEAEGLGTYRVAPEGVDGLVAHQPGEDGDEEGAHDVGGIGRVGTGVTQGRAAEEAVEEARFAEVFGEVGNAAEVGHPPLAVPAGTEGGYAAAEGGRVWVLTSGGESARVEDDGGFHGRPLVLKLQKTLPRSRRPFTR